MQACGAASRRSMPRSQIMPWLPPFGCKPPGLKYTDARTCKASKRNRCRCPSTCCSYRQRVSVPVNQFRIPSTCFNLRSDCARGTSGMPGPSPGEAGTEDLRFRGWRSSASPAGQPWIHLAARSGPRGRWGPERRAASSELMRSVTLIRDLARPRVFHLDACERGETADTTRGGTDRHQHQTSHRVFSMSPCARAGSRVVRLSSR